MPEVDQAAPAQSTQEPIILTPREPVAPAAPASPKKALMELNEAERLEWRTSGALPDAAPPAAPAPPVEEPRTVSKRQEKINEYERRIAEQDAELTRLRAPKPPAAPRSDPQQEPERAPVTLAETIARPDLRQPPISEADFYTKFAESGVGDYAEYRSAYRYAYNKLADQRQTLEQQAASAEEARVAKARQGLDDAAKADPAFTAKIAPLLSTLQTREQAMQDGKRPGPEHDFGSALVRSEVAAKLLDHIADHPAVMDTVRALESRSDVLTFFGRLEAKFLDDPKPAADQPPPPKTFTTAPDPPVVLGSRPGEPVDAVVGALKRKDQAAYTRELNARDLAARRG